MSAQNIKEKQLKNIRLTHTKINDIQTMNASRTQRQRDCSYMSPKNKHKHNYDNVYILYNNMNFKYYKNRKNAIALVFV